MLAEITYSFGMALILVAVRDLREAIFRGQRDVMDNLPPPIIKFFKILALLHIPIFIAGFFAFDWWVPIFYVLGSLTVWMPIKHFVIGAVSHLSAMFFGLIGMILTVTILIVQLT